MNYTIDLFSVFIFLGIVQAIFLSFFFLSRENRKIPANFFQGILLIIIACVILEIFVMYTGYIVHCFYLVDYSESMSLAIGPLFYFIVLSLTQGSVSKEKYWHLLPAVIYTFLLIPFLMLPEDAKYNAWVYSYHPEMLARDFKYPGSVNIFGIRSVITELTLLSIFIYAVWILILTVKAFRKKGESFFYPRSTTLRTLQSLIFQIFSVSVIVLIVKLTNLNDTGDHIFATFIALTVYFTSFSVIRHSGFFKPAVLDAQQKYKTSSLTPEAQQAALTKLGEVMKNEKPFLQPDFSLPELASRLRMSVHQLSQVINDGLGKSFFEMAAEYRIEEAKKMLKEKPAIKVEEIAEEVGYSSKSSFNTAFKKLTGKTPSQWREF
jgi:AraC-like DNA-binding protein